MIYSSRRFYYYCRWGRDWAVGTMKIERGGMWESPGCQNQGKIQIWRQLKPWKISKPAEKLWKLGEFWILNVSKPIAPPLTVTQFFLLRARFYLANIIINRERVKLLWKWYTNRQQAKAVWQHSNNGKSQPAKSRFRLFCEWCAILGDGRTLIG